jgi:signal transduction histidine kinase
VRVDSEPGRGTEFVVTLPRATRAVKTQATRKEIGA